jgi:hypothetical protein
MMAATFHQRRSLEKEEEVKKVEEGNAAEKK